MLEVLFLCPKRSFFIIDHMRRFFVFMTIFVVVCGAAMAQVEVKESPIKVEMHGFVGLSMMLDSRQSVNVRHNQIHLYPKPAQYDPAGEDINAQGMRRFDASHSRLGFFISGPDLLGAKASAVLEGDFLGGSGANDVNFRIRQANVKLQWEKSFVLVGQAFHPLFVTENYPNTQSLSAGAPYHPLNRSFQLQVGHNLSDQWCVTGYVLGQNDFKSVGFTGADLSLIPEFAARIRYQNANGFFAVLNGGVLTLEPELVDAAGYKSDARIVAPYVSGSAKYAFDKLQVKGGFVYGGNMTSHVMIGGVGQKADGDYVPLRTLSTWIDAQYPLGRWTPGVFGGYSANKGASTEAEAVEKYSRAANIGELYAISPRLYFNASPKFWIGVEYLMNRALYGAEMDEYAKPYDFTAYTNHRLSLNARYIF